MDPADKSRIWKHSICCARLRICWNNDRIVAVDSLTRDRLKVGQKATAFVLADAPSFANNLLNRGTSSRRLHEKESMAVPGGQCLCTATVKTDFTFTRPYCNALYNAPGPGGAASD